MNFYTNLRRTADRTPNAVAIRHNTDELTYADLFDRSARVARFLVERGVQPGQRVGILMHNQPEWIVSLLGVWQAGGVVVPYNYLFHPSALRHTTIDADVQWLITTAADVPRAFEALDGLDVLNRIISVDEPADDLTTLPFTTLGAMLSATEPLTEVVPRLDGDDAVLMYTSGSTGQPKGVRQTHRNCGAVSEATIDIWSITDRDRALVCTPLFHVGGLQLMTLPMLLAGGETTLRRWVVREWLQDAERLEVTVTALVPAMMIDIVNELRDRRLPLDSIRICAIGGSALPQSRLEALTAATNIVPVNIYGQTEQSGLSITEPPHEARREGSMGKPMEQIVQARIVTPLGHDVVIGEIGELCVRGDAVTPGYWQLPEANASKFTEDGWFRTSDLVRQDQNGYLYYVDRTDDMIISGGENVFPQMVEGFLSASPLVAEVAVIGTPHERLSNQVTAIVVPTASDISAADIAAYCESDPNLRGLQRPRRIEIVNAIPRTATNKIDRPLLKKRFI